MTSLWLNIWRDTARNELWISDHQSEAAAIEDAAESPIPAMIGGPHVYVETHRITLGAGTDLSDAAQRLLDAQEREREHVRVMRASHVREVIGGLA